MIIIYRWIMLMDLLETCLHQYRCTGYRDEFYASLVCPSLGLLVVRPTECCDTLVPVLAPTTYAAVVLNEVRLGAYRKYDSCFGHGWILVRSLSSGGLTAMDQVTRHTVCIKGQGNYLKQSHSSCNFIAITVVNKQALRVRAANWLDVPPSNKLLEKDQHSPYACAQCNVTTRSVGCCNLFAMRRMLQNRSLS